MNFTTEHALSAQSTRAAGSASFCYDGGGPILWRQEQLFNGVFHGVIKTREKLIYYLQPRLVLPSQILVTVLRPATCPRPPRPPPPPHILSAFKSAGESHMIVAATSPRLIPHTPYPHSHICCRRTDYHVAPEDMLRLGLAVSPPFVVTLFSSVRRNHQKADHIRVQPTSWSARHPCPHSGSHPPSHPDLNAH